jgi:molybdopterin converting factor subunit 1
MPNFSVLTFAAAREIVGADHFQLDLPAGATVADLRTRVLEVYPALSTLTNFAIARNEEYAISGDVLEVGDELVIIPPVSGG